MGKYRENFSGSGWTTGWGCCKAAQVSAAAASFSFHVGCKKAALLSG
ncbi:MAG: hypothetical protein ACLTXT_07970 [Ruminococcus callidus]